jgi:hypothetical protein
MKTKKTTRILQETHEALSVRHSISRQPRTAPVWCEECAGQVPLVAPEEATRRAGLSVRAICRLVEAGLIHFRETPDGLLLVCPDSIAGRNADA